MTLEYIENFTDVTIAAILYLLANADATEK